MDKLTRALNAYRDAVAMRARFEEQQGIDGKREAEALARERVLDAANELLYDDPRG